MDRRLILLLAERLGGSSEDLGYLSTRLIEEAAAGYKLSENMLLSQTSVAIAKRYVEDCQEGLRDKLKSQSPEEAQATDAALKDLLNHLSANERLDVQKTLGLESLSAQSIREVIVRSGVPLAGIAAVQAGGFGGYLALTTMMHAVFTSMLGITLPFAAYTTATSALSILTGPFGIIFSLSLGAFGYFWGRRKIERSQYAMLVFACVTHASEALIPPTASLPSFQAYKLLDVSETSIETVSAPTSEASDFLVLKQLTAEKEATEKRTAEASEEREKVERQIHSLEEQLKRAQDLINSFSYEQTASSSLNASLEKIAIDQEAKRNRTQRELESTRQALNEALRKEAAERVRSDALVAKREVHIERKSKELLAIWEIRYQRIEFSPAPVRWAAKQEFSSRLEIERALTELHEARDPVSLSRGKMHGTKEDHCRFTLSDGTECRAYYKVRDGVIFLSKMGKKKDFENL